MKRALRRTALGLVAAMVTTLVMLVSAGPAQAAPIAIGNVMVSVSNGLVQEHTPTGTLVQTLNTGHPGTFTTGSTFDGAGNFYVTTFNGNAVAKFDANGVLVGDFGSGYNANPESILFDQAGNAYVGQADGTQDVLKFTSAGAPVTSFNVATEARGSDWIDLAADQCTLFYTSEGFFVKRFNVCTNTQLADFATLPGRPSYALRLLPSGGLLVADTDRVVRLDATGAVVQTYLLGANNGGLFALNLDPNGTSFWTADFNSSTVWKLNIATGAIEQQWNTGTASGSVFGLSVKGEITVGGPGDTTKPTCQLTKKTAAGIEVTVQDAGSGLQSIVVTKNVNTNTTVPAFAPGSTSPVVVTSNKINANQASQLELRVTDVAGNVTICDPIITTVKAGGLPQVFSGIPDVDDTVTVTNGSPGLDTVLVVLNGKPILISQLKPGEVRTVDVGPALKLGRLNTVAVSGTGSLGSSAEVMIWDGNA